MSAHPGWPAVLTDGPVILRPFRRSDAAAWSQTRRENQHWLAPWEPIPPCSWYEANSPAVFRRMLRESNKAGRQGRSMTFAVCYDEHLTGDARLVGQITVGNIVRRAFCSAYVGYWVDGRYAGRGITPTALALVTDHAFNHAGLHRIEVNIRPENRASRRVVEKLGFRQEALHRRYLHIDGDWRDHLGYALTVEDVQEEGGLVARWHRIRGS